jgi:hypothetical protein
MKPKAVFLRGLKGANHHWLKEEAKRQGYTLSGFVNHLVEGARENQSLCRELAQKAKKHARHD